MKTSKLIIAFVAILMFSNVLFAGNPINIGNPDDYATKSVTRLGTEITLTDSQKIILQAKTKAYVLKIQNANSLSDSEQKSALIKSYREYKAAKDSVLTPIQKSQLTAKEHAMADSILSIIKSKKKK